MKKITLFFITFLVCISSVSSQPVLQKQIDSLFVIASSGALKYRDLTGPAQDEIAALGVDAVPILVNKFTTKSARERLTIINILKKIGKDAVPYLIRSLKNPDGLIVQRVCWTLGDIKDSSAVEPLIAVSNHKRWQVREQAIGALGDIADNLADDAVLFAFNDPIGQVRKAAAVAAGKLGILETVTLLVNQLGDEFYGARMSASEALLKIDTNYVTEIISDSLQSTNPFVRSLGCQLLGQFASDPAIEILYNLARSSQDNTQTHAVLALIEADPMDNCGYQKVILQSINDRLSLLKIESAIRTARHEQKEPER